MMDACLLCGDDQVNFSFGYIGSVRTFTSFFRDLTREKLDQLQLEEEKKKSQNLLLNILPSRVVSRLKNDERPIADEHQNASIL